MMRKKLFHPNQYDQHHIYTKIYKNNPIGELYAMQPEHLVHSILYRIEAIDQGFSNQTNTSDIKFES